MSCLVLKAPPLRQLGVEATMTGIVVDCWYMIHLGFSFGLLLSEVRFRRHG